MSYPPVLESKEVLSAPMATFGGKWGFLNCLLWGGTVCVLTNESGGYREVHVGAQAGVCECLGICVSVINVCANVGGKMRVHGSSGGKPYAFH